METPKGHSASTRFQQVVGYGLLAGVALTSLFLIAGFLWQQNVGMPEQEYLRTNVAELWRTSARAFQRRTFQPSTLVELGLASLLATPYLRVILSVFYFAFVERNWKYTFITLFVLTFLTYHLFFR